jgi:acyl-CoA thioesterase FadM
MYCIYQNKDKFADGKSFKLKVSIWSNRDGVDKDLMAEGTITLVYKNENKAKIDMAMQHMDNFLNE